MVGIFPDSFLVSCTTLTLDLRKLANSVVGDLG